MQQSAKQSSVYHQRPYAPADALRYAASHNQET
jgi:hypothetical protein